MGSPQALTSHPLTPAEMLSRLGMSETALVRKPVLVLVVGEGQYMWAATLVDGSKETEVGCGAEAGIASISVVESCFCVS